MDLRRSSAGFLGENAVTFRLLVVPRDTKRVQGWVCVCNCSFCLLVREKYLPQSVPDLLFLTDM